MDRLSVEESQRFWKTLDDFDAATEKINKIYSVLVGDKELQQEGVIERLSTVEDKVDGIEKQLANSKSWIAGAMAVGGGLAALVGWVYKFFNH